VVLGFALAGLSWERQHSAVDARFQVALLYSCASALIALALIGSFARWMEAPHPVLSRLARSSYWIYLVHLPLLAAFDLVLRGWAIPAMAKVFINSAACFIVALLSYHWLIRDTWIDALLNGRVARAVEPRRPGDGGRVVAS
jgi:peptidoglycan/LPS O-acetylase OafA/YrhL